MIKILLAFILGIKPYCLFAAGINHGNPGGMLRNYYNVELQIKTKLSPELNVQYKLGQVHIDSSADSLLENTHFLLTSTNELHLYKQANTNCRKATIPNTNVSLVWQGSDCGNLLGEKIFREILLNTMWFKIN